MYTIAQKIDFKTYVTLKKIPLRREEGKCRLSELLE